MGACLSDSRPTEHKSQIEISRKKPFIPELEFWQREQTEFIRQKVELNSRKREEVIFKKDPKENVTIYVF